MSNYMPYHKQVTVPCPVSGGLVTADEGIINDLQVLWYYGISTQYSCQGDYPGTGDRYVMLADVRDVDAAIELLPWASANLPDRMSGCVYYRPGGALRGIFPIGLNVFSGDLH